VSSIEKMYVSKAARLPAHAYTLTNANTKSPDSASGSVQDKHRTSRQNVVSFNHRISIEQLLILVAQERHIQQLAHYRVFCVHPGRGIF
jgi:hypothetical protein